MNSFYGVLGTPGCRFAASDIAGAITSFGHEMLAWSRRFFESKGYEALYGDTDSLFIQGDAKDADTELIERRGAELAKEATEKLSAYVTERWGVASHLELEFEYLYLQFFLPALRGSSGTRFREVDVAALQGRAKGYAGLRSDDGEIEIKGMEAIRRDWTEAAKQLQRMLLASIFSGEGPESIERTVVEYIESIENGRMNDTLIYFKALRKSADSYTRNKPPHVRAAMHLPPSERRGLIPYLWTIEGPIPPTPNARGDGFEPFAGPAIDYAHYIEKQIRPIVEGVGDVIGHNFSRVFDRDPQRELF